MQLLKGHFKYSLYKLISTVFASFAWICPAKCLLPVLVVNLRNDFCLFAWPCSSFSCLRNLCLPLCLFCHLISLSDAEVKVMFYILLLLARWVSFWVSKLKCDPAMFAVLRLQKNLRNNSLYSILLPLFYVPHDYDDKIEMIATLLNSFDKFWKTCIVITIPNIKCYIYFDSLSLW